MSNAPNRVEQLEEQRIRVAYASRKQQIPADRYSPFQRGHLLCLQEVELRLLDLFKTHGLSDLADLHILEVGCGSGFWLRKLIQWGAQPDKLTGIDLIPEHIAEARVLTPASVCFETGNADAVCVPSESYDVVCQFVMLSSILDVTFMMKIAGEMDRLLKPGGAIVWYDLHTNNPFNSDVRGIPRADIRDLFPSYDMDLRRVTLAPPIARRVGALSVFLHRALSLIPLTRSHYVGILEKPCRQARKRS